MAGIKSLSMSKYFEIKHPVYEALEIIAHLSVRNYNSATLAKMVSDMYRSITKSIKSRAQANSGNISEM